MLANGVLPPDAGSAELAGALADAGAGNERAIADAGVVAVDDAGPEDGGAQDAGAEDGSVDASDAGADASDEDGGEAVTGEPEPAEPLNTLWWSAGSTASPRAMAAARTTRATEAVRAAPAMALARAREPRASARVSGSANSPACRASAPGTAPEDRTAARTRASAQASASDPILAPRASERWALVRAARGISASRASVVGRTPRGAVPTTGFGIPREMLGPSANGRRPRARTARHSARTA